MSFIEPWQLRARFARSLSAMYGREVPAYTALVDAKDPAAFEVFYDRHGGAAYSLAHRIVGDRQLAEDVIQEAFLSIWRSSARYDPARGSVRSWTLGVVRNRAVRDADLL